jgi:DUF1365 family protein
MPRDDAPAATAQPQLCVGQVWHRRLRPHVSEFKYGGFYLRLPLRTMQQQGFATGLCRRNRFGLMAFYDRDHGDGHTPLLQWIDRLLSAQDVVDADGEIWLQAMPRVFGYVFNPVSFWFCHRRDGALRAVVCEVRNTFGERHLYLLDTGQPIGNGTELQARKVFHVSPFCNVEGGYRFRFSRTQVASNGVLNDVTLARINYDDAAGPLLQTSVSGVAMPITHASVSGVLLRFPLMTLGVVVRIHWQALRLWLRRTPFFHKPAPPQQKVTR